MHQRQQIRAAVVATLNAVPAFANRVHATRLTPFDQKLLPRVCVYTLNENSGLDTASELLRQVSLQIEVIVAGFDQLDDVIDGHAVSIEKAIGANRTLGGAAFDCELTATALSTHMDGEKKTGHGKLTYQVTYRTSAGDPEVNNP